MFHYCAHCNYRSQTKFNVRRHQSFKHKTPYDEVVEHPLPTQRDEEVVEPPMSTQRDEQPMDLDLLEDSIQIFRIFKLLQRMKINDAI